MEISAWLVEYYLVSSGLSPFQEWRNGIADARSKASIDARIARMRGGNFGDSRPVGSGVSEARVHFGPGFRIYYGLDGKKIILLDGGDKSSQANDIANAKGFWNEYKKQKKSREEKARLQERPAQRPKKR
jgi:putative addiction module killer protein